MSGVLRYLGMFPQHFILDRLNLLPSESNLVNVYWLGG